MYDNNLQIFKDFDFENFWSDIFLLETYTEEYPTDELIKSIEQELGYKLPESYIEFMRVQNGGSLQKCCYSIKNPTKSVSSHILVSNFAAIGRKKNCSICGSMGAKYRIDEWYLPNTGIYFCETSGGFEVVMFDYSKCDNNGEPEVVYFDPEVNETIFLAKNFEEFVRNLVDCQETEI